MALGPLDLAHNTEVPSEVPKFTSLTQEQQNREDEKAKRKALKDLTQSWMDRLQLISLITTFFASVEAGMLQITTPGQGATSTAWEKATNAGFLGALVIHVWAAIISFLAAFFLVRYNLKEAKEEELEVEGVQSPSEHSSRSNSFRLPLKHIWTTSPHLEQVGPFQRKPPTHLLSRCHSLCIFLSILGFAMALMGILCFGWAQQPTPVSVVATACMAFCFLSSVLVFLPSSFFPFHQAF